MFSHLKNEFITQLMSTAPPHLLNVKTELEQWIHGFLSAWLEKHDLVTKQEFDLQVKSLQITQKKVEQLQHQLSQLVIDPPLMTSAHKPEELKS